MNKKMMGAITLILAVTMCACADSPDPADTVLDMQSNIGKAEDAVNDFKQAGAEIDEEGAAALGESAEPGVEQPTVNAGYNFTFKGVKMTPDDNFAPLLAQLGEPANYYEAKSCAFEGKDKVYSYGSVDISTYPQGEDDFISYIDFRDDTVTTEEGAYLFMAKNDVLKMYGENYTEKLGAYCYPMGNMELRFIFENDAVVSIQYATLVLQE